jgi:hypothetical protein
VHLPQRRWWDFRRLWGEDRGERFVELGVDHAAVIADQQLRRISLASSSFGMASAYFGRAASVSRSPAASCDVGAPETACCVFAVDGHLGAHLLLDEYKLIHHDRWIEADIERRGTWAARSAPGCTAVLGPGHCLSMCFRSGNCRGRGMQTYRTSDRDIPQRGIKAE